MKEKSASFIKIILTMILFIMTLTFGFFMRKVQMVNTKELSAVPASSTLAAAGMPAATPASLEAVASSEEGVTSGQLLYGPPAREVVSSHFRKIKPKVLPTPTPRPTPVPTPSAGADKTGRIASYFQAGASWKSGLTWSGDWGKKKYKGKKFGAFGCGLCCMANIYSSLSPYRSSPLDMYEFAKEVSGYEGAGAIEWWNMYTVLEKAGFHCEMGKKPDNYKEFQKLVRKSKAVVVLVSKHNKKSMWKHTTGHYVTLFLYDKASDKVFLADPGSYKRNRKWVSLEKIYDSLKTKSDRQYLLVTEYKKEKDSWRNTEFTGKCRLPSNWKTD